MSVWIEVALNGPWSRARQKLMPLTVDEIVADGIDRLQASGRPQAAVQKRRTKARGSSSRFFPIDMSLPVAALLLE